MSREQQSGASNRSAGETAVSVERDGDVIVLSVHGELDLATAHRLSEPLAEQVAAGEAHLLVDLTGCEFIDSSGIRVILVQRRRIDSNGGGDRPPLAIAAPDGQVLSVLRLSGIEELIPIADSRLAALELLG
jgi:anti-sigma B factor antagonist